jgi:hypothetical protein
MEEFIIDIPTWDNGNWTTTTFNSVEEFKEYILSIFKLPGQYRFNKDLLAAAKEEAFKFEKQDYYCSKPFMSKDYVDYWDFQKNKCRKGLIVKSGKESWFLTRDYYMWLNFLPIFDKEKTKFGFAKLRDAQYHMALYELLAELHYKHAAILKKRQIASEQPHSEPVLGEHGWATMGDIQPGDKLWNPDGTLTTVLHKSNNGLSDVYEFKFGDGRTTRCGIEHNWEVYDKAAKKTKVLNTKQLLEIGIFQTPVKGIKKVYNNYRFAIKLCKPLPLLNSPVPVDPYTLGALLGDGHINNKSIYISGEDEEVFKNISKSLGSDYILKTTGYLKKSITYLNRFTHDGKEYKNSKFGVNPLLRECLALGLGKSGKNTKFIPDVYKTASIEDRIALVQGLMDTDGYVNDQGNDIHFTNVNKRLIHDFTEVVRSLGIKAKVDVKQNEHGSFYRVRISGNINFELFRLTRKKERFKKRKSKNTFDKVPLMSITKLDYQEDSSCIVVDNPNHLYITRDYIVTHNSYFHAGKLINQLWFEEGVTLKIGAALKDYINDKGTWKFLDEYANFLNEHTAWYRPLNPKKVLMWQQKIEEKVNGRSRDKGLKGTIQGMSFEKDPTNSVGGPVKYFFHEEAGIAPKMDQTYEYIRPALKSGFVTTGLFIAAGSVGDLDQCGPLKDMINHPKANDIYAVETNLIDEKETIGLSGLFIPEQWSMPPYIDAFGNSLVEDALKALDEQFAEWKKELTPEQYQLRISQHPRNIKEAFATRTVSKFPQHLLSHQAERIREKEYAYEFVEIFQNGQGKPEVKTTNKIPVYEFPVSKKATDKTGAVVVWERPVENPEYGMYYASIDPVGEGRAEYVNNLIYTPYGQKRIGDVKPGEYVIGSNGLPTRVKNVYPQGKKELYRVAFDDGCSLLVCKEHLWALDSNGGERRDKHILSVEDLLNKEKYLSFTGIGRNLEKIYKTKTYFKNNKNSLKWKVPISKPIQFVKNEVPLDSYFLGLLLGDGGISQKSIRFTTADPELITYIKDILPSDITIKYLGRYDYAITTNKSRNSISKILRDLDLKGKTGIDKFIPQVYLLSSVEERLALLQGLMDTDGYCGNHGSEYYSISINLAQDVVKLVQSLGGIAKIRKKITNRKERNGVGYIYIVRVILPEPFCPFRLKRKVVLYTTPQKFSRYIKDITYEKEAEAVCLEVEAEDHLYVTEHALVTHNTTTSESLCSIYVYKRKIEVTKVNGDEVTTYVERDKVVCAWCGRYDDINTTHERLRLIIEWYNAKTLVENNISQFINYMIGMNKQKYLVRKDEMVFLKDLGSNSTVYQEYGWKNTGRLFKDHLLSYVIEYVKEAIDEETKEDGTVVKTTYGVERIPDPMLIVEMQAYEEGLNVDRLVSFAALVAYMKILESNMGLKKRIEKDDAAKKLEKSENLFKLNKSPFRHVGNSSTVYGQKIKRNAFKNLK